MSNAVQVSVHRAADRRLGLREVMHRTGLSRTTIWRREREGLFPQRQRDGGRVFWFESEFDNWLTWQKAQRADLARQQSFGHPENDDVR